MVLSSQLCNKGTASAVPQTQQKKGRALAPEGMFALHNYSFRINRTDCQS
jgi:hypothetical protein